MNKKLIGIVPLGGSASRMMNLPKFLLPCGTDKTLLANTVDIYLNNNIYEIRAGVSEDNAYLLRNNLTLNKTVVNTQTMAETVHLLINEVEYDDYSSILIMPDTYFILKDELKNMVNKLDSCDIVAILWKIKDYQKGKVGQCDFINGEIVDVVDKDLNCNYEYFWGCLGWTSNMNKYIDPKWGTVGDLIKHAISLNIKVGAVISDGDYYDCGTFDEYFKMIKEKTN